MKDHRRQVVPDRSMQMLVGVVLYVIASVLVFGLVCMFVNEAGISDYESQNYTRTH